MYDDIKIARVVSKMRGRGQCKKEYRTGVQRYQIRYLEDHSWNRLHWNEASVMKVGTERRNEITQIS